VHLPAFRSAGTRQVDVLVRGDVFGIEDATLVIDCKRYDKNLNINHVDQFLGLLDDVAADLGILVTTKGASPKALERLRTARGARARVMSLSELERWVPTGSATISLRIAAQDEQAVTRALREAGFRVRPDEVLERGDGQVVVAALIRLASGHQDGQADIHERAGAALDRIRVPHEVAASGVTIGGGTPAHRWLEVTAGGTALGLNVLVANEEDLDQQLGQIAGELGLPREALDADRPDGWPATGLFAMP
jgi:hypothetical protein